MERSNNCSLYLSFEFSNPTMLNPLKWNTHDVYRIWYLDLLLRSYTFPEDLNYSQSGRQMTMGTEWTNNDDAMISMKTIWDKNVKYFPLQTYWKRKNNVLFIGCSQNFYCWSLRYIHNVISTVWSTQVQRNFIQKGQ